MKENTNKPLNVYNYKINDIDYNITCQFITAKQILEVSKTPSDFGVWIKTKHNEFDEEIKGSDSVDLKEQNLFYTGNKMTTQ